MSSFRKRIVRHPIPGTRTSPQTGQVITSSGNPSLDVILGGGLPIGSVCLIEEDKFVSYSKVLAKYFLAEGVLSTQSIFLGSLDDSPKEFIKKLPQQCAVTVEEEIPEVSKNGLRIAWRYNDLPIVNSEQTDKTIGHNFNLMEYMDSNLLKFAHTVTWCDNMFEDSLQQYFEDDEEVTYLNPDENNIPTQVDYNKQLDKENSKNNSFDDTQQDSGDVSCPQDLPDAMDIQNVTTAEMNSNQQPDLENTKTTSTPNSADCMDYKPEVEDKKTSSSTETASSSSIPIPPSPICKETHIFNSPKYFRLIKHLQSLMSEEKFLSGGFLMKRSLCRVCITSLGSPPWYDDNFDKDLLKFLTILRALVHSSVSVCFITMPMHLVAKYDETLVSKIRNLVDYSIELESFAGSEKETNPAFKEYNGLLHLRKMAAVNSLSAYMPETTDLAFKLKRKKFVIEKLHLPPELQDNSTDSTFSCGSNTDLNSSNSMDF